MLYVLYRAVELLYGMNHSYMCLYIFQMGQGKISLPIRARIQSEGNYRNCSQRASLGEYPNTLFCNTEYYFKENPGGYVTNTHTLNVKLNEIVPQNTTQLWVVNCFSCCFSIKCKKDSVCSLRSNSTIYVLPVANGCNITWFMSSVYSVYEHYKPSD